MIRKTKEENWDEVYGGWVGAGGGRDIHTKDVSKPIRKPSILQSLSIYVFIYIFIYIYSFNSLNADTLHRDYAYSRSHRLLNKKPRAYVGYLLLSSWTLRAPVFSLLLSLTRI